MRRCIDVSDPGRPRKAIIFDGADRSSNMEKGPSLYNPGLFCSLCTSQSSCIQCAPKHLILQTIWNFARYSVFTNSPFSHVPALLKLHTGYKTNII